MAGAYAYTPAVWLPLAGAVLLVATGLYSWRCRDLPAALPLATDCLFSAFWLLGIALEAAAVAPATKIFWFKFQALWAMPTATAGVCFVLEYAFPGRWLTRRNLVLLSIPVVVSTLLVLITSVRLSWTRVMVGADGAVVAELAPAGAIVTAYGVSLVLVNAAVLIWLFVRSPLHRWPVTLMVGGQLASRVLYVVDAARWPWPAGVDPLTTSLLLSAATYAVALFGFRILDPVPAARTAALEQMRDGMVVFDPQWRVVSVNRAAAGIVGASPAGARGIRAEEVLPTFGDLAARLAAGRGDAFEVSLGPECAARTCEADVCALHDFRDVFVGYLLLLRDVTEGRRAQAQILEQQRSLAMLREREQLARELHDGIGQVMGYASLQLEVVQGCIRDGQRALAAGQGADAGAHLVEGQNHVARLSRVVEEAHADVREHILNLRVAPSDQRPFFATLRHYLDGFSQNYGIQTELAVGASAEAGLLDASSQMQLFRIIQEALSNARKHAGASCVRLSFETAAGRLTVRIEDNGRGFDPARAVRAAEGRFGLRIMAERAESIGGSLAVRSEPGAGTSVVIELALGAGGVEEAR